MTDAFSAQLGGVATLDEEQSLVGDTLWRQRADSYPSLISFIMRREVDKQSPSFTVIAEG